MKGNVKEPVKRGFKEREEFKKWFDRIDAKGKLNEMASTIEGCVDITDEQTRSFLDSLTEDEHEKLYTELIHRGATLEYDVTTDTYRLCNNTGQ